MKDFLPPFDREDIILLSNKLDDLVDAIDEIVIELNILGIKTLRADMLEIVNLLCSCTSSTKELLEQFKDMKKLAKNKSAELTKKQKLFCVFYCQSFNATQSYLKAYGGKKNSAQSSSSKLLSPKASLKSALFAL